MEETYPYWIFDTQSLEKLRPIEAAIKESDVIFSKVFEVFRMGDHVIFRTNATDFRSWVKIPLQNQENRMDGVFIVEAKPFMSAVKTAGPTLTLRAVDRALSAYVLGGRVVFENYNIDTNTFKHPGLELELESMEEVKGSLLCDFLKKAHKTMGMARRPEDRRCRITDHKAVSSFTDSVVLHNSVPLKDVSLRGMDLSFLANVFNGSNDVFYKKEGGYYSFYNSDSSIRVMVPAIDTEDILDYLDRVYSFDHTFKLDAGNVSKAFKLLLSLIGDTGSVSIRARGGWLELLAYTRSGKLQEFPLQKLEYDLDMELHLPVYSIYKIGDYIKGDDCILSFPDNGEYVVFSIGDMDILFGSIIEEREEDNDD